MFSLESLPRDVQNCDMRYRFMMAAVLACGLGTITGSWAAQKPTELVDINRASVAELLALPGITEIWAQRIVRFRPYRTKLDLLNEGVVPADIYGRIREGIVAHRDGAKGKAR